MCGDVLCDEGLGFVGKSVGHGSESSHGFDGSVESFVFDLVESLVDDGEHEVPRVPEGVGDCGGSEHVVVVAGVGEVGGDVSGVGDPGSG